MNRSGPRTKDSVADRSSQFPAEPEAFASRVGDCIRATRQARGWTQAQLAQESELSVNYVARLERGELSPSLHVGARIARALEISLESLVVGEVVPNRTGKRLSK